jgi:hypothetical protein
MTSEFMRYRFAACAAFAFALLIVGTAIVGDAQDRPAQARTDPRVGLKPGFRDAGEAAHNMERLASLPKPEGFFDPKAPAGTPTGPERGRGAGNAGRGGAEAGRGARPDADDPEAADSANRGRGAGDAAAPGAPPAPVALGFANSDLAFSGNHLIVGSFHGFNTYDIEKPKSPRLLASTVCPGGQGDVSVYGRLLFMSVEQTRGRVDCGVQGVQATVSAERFRGVRIFDISDIDNPRQLAAVQTCRGSHTHTLVTSPSDSANVYIYGSGTGAVRSAEELAGCSGLDPAKDPNTSLYSIDVIQVPLAAPQNARIVSRPRIFSDAVTGAIAGLWQGGNHGPGTQSTSLTNRCHDITVFPEIGLAAGACSGNGILLDISDPVRPVRLDQVTDRNFAFWHSATFNHDGTKVIFTDEWGGGTRPRCRATDLPSWGADAIFDVVDRKLRFGAYYKMPAPQTEQENCVAHNGSIIPVPGRDLMVQGWYQGGVSVFDFTDSAHPIEIAYFDRGPIDAKELFTGGYWSAYWYNGFIYGSEIARGVDVFRLTPSEHLSQNEIDAASLIRTNELNTQQQTRIAWPATGTVARAYLDQLTRSKGIGADRARAVRDAVGRADDLRTGKERGAGRVLDQLSSLAAQLDQDAAAATGPDAIRLRLLAGTMRERVARLR